MAPQTTDPFDDLLTLEDTLYTTAHSQGIADGSRAGRIEGRIFGLEKGFEKFAALGELHGRGAVWGARIAGARSLPPTMTTTTPSTTSTTPATTTTTTAAAQNSTPAQASTTLPQFPIPSSRLTTNISLLYHLTDPPTFSTANTEPSVADYDDRFKRAGAKAKVVERIIGESTYASNQEATAERAGGASKARNVRLEGEGSKSKSTRGRGGGGKGGDDNMEDFGGSRLII